MASDLFALARQLAESMVALDDLIPDEWDGGQLGYELGGMHDIAAELLPLLDKADELLAANIREAWKKGVADAEEAAAFVGGFLGDLAQTEYARNADGSLMTPEQSDTGWAVQ